VKGMKSPLALGFEAHRYLQADRRESPNSRILHEKPMRESSPPLM
jgi:hypothetical protein